MIFHDFINAEMCRAYVRVYAICQYLHISKALDKLVSNLHPQSSTSCRHLIHIVMICNDPSCSRDIIPTFYIWSIQLCNKFQPEIIIQKHVSCSPQWCVPKKSWGKRSKSMQPWGPPKPTSFYLSRTHSPYGTILVPGLGACWVSNFGGLQGQRYQKWWEGVF